MSDSGGIIAEKAAFDALGRQLLALLAPGDVDVRLDASVLAPVALLQVRARNPRGKYKTDEGSFNAPRLNSQVSDAVTALRAAAYREGAGTWFSARIAVTADGAASAEYNYDDEPHWDAPVDSVAYVTDFKHFPRDEAHQPDWLRAKLAEGRAKHT